MTDGLEIAGIQVSEPYPAGLAHPATGVQPDWVKVRVTLVNRSPTTTYHVGTQLRKVGYDPATRTLELLLDEPEEDVAPHLLAHLNPPPMKAVGPGSTETVDVTVPAVINNITGFGPDGAQVEQLPAHELERVHAVIGFDSEPFQAAPETHGLELHRQLLAWGGRVEATMTPQRG